MTAPAQEHELWTKGKDMGEEELEEAVRACLGAIVKERDCDFFIYAGPLRNGYEDVLIHSVRAIQNRRKNAVLFLDTYGGHADCAYKIGRAFQRNYERFTIFVDESCKSAGTLLCTGADELCIGDCGELGPLDVQMPKEGEFNGRRSGLEISDTLNALQDESVKLMRTHFLDLRVGSGTQITTKDALKNATKLVCGLLAPIYQQISPLSLGEAARSNLVALHYGNRLASARNAMHPEGLAKLISGYPSHGFVIDRDEARELFMNVNGLESWDEFIGPLLRKKYEQLADRTSPLIVCLSAEYNLSLAQETSSYEPETEDADPEPAGQSQHEGEGAGSGVAPVEAANDAAESDAAKRVGTTGAIEGRE
jgi:hypothetical protein